MPKLSTEEKKALILDTCKELFYKKGYTGTTYEDINTAAGLPPGSVTNYYSGKKALAETIHAEYEMKVKTAISLLAGDDHELRVMSALEIIYWWQLFYTSPNIRRFIVEISKEGILRKSLAGNTQHFFKQQIDEYGIKMDSSRFKLVTNAYIGMVTALLLNADENFSSHTADEVADFVIESAYKMLNVDRAVIIDAINRAHEIYRGVKLSDAYYEFFKYDETKL